jgi:hypothetical protein
MSSRIAQHTTKSKENTKRVYDGRIKLLEVYGTPIPDYFIDEVRMDMKEWSDKATSLRFKDFLTDRRINSKVFYDWCNRNPELQQEYEWTLDKIASRREIGAGRGKLNPTILRMMPRYDPEWLENEERLAKIKRLSQVESVAGQTIIAVIPEVPNSPLVPTMKREIEDE